MKTDETGKPMIYLDNAATTWPKPAAVERAICDCLRRRGGNPGRSAHPLSLAASEILYEARTEAANLFGAGEPENVVFTGSATVALNMALKGILRPGDHVLTSDLEHNAVMRPLKSLAKHGVQVTAVPVDFDDDEQTVRNFESRMQRNTKVIVCTHGSNVCGYRSPIQKLGELAGHHTVLIADASQTAGNVPISLREMKIDILCTAGHKGLYGPQGTGMMVFGSRKNLPETILEGGGGYDPFSPDMPAELPEKLEPGTPNTPGIAGLLAGMRFVRKTGVENIGAYERNLAEMAMAGLQRIPGVRPVSGRNDSGIVSFNIEGLGCNEAAAKLASFGICVRSGFHCAPAAHRVLGTEKSGCVRASFGVFNQENDVLSFLYAVSRIAEKAGR